MNCLATQIKIIKNVQVIFGTPKIEYTCLLQICENSEASETEFDENMLEN